MVAVYTVFAVRGWEGLKVAVVRVVVTTPATGAEFGPVTRNVVEDRLVACIARLNVARIAVFTGTSVAPLLGATKVTVGATPGPAMGVP